MAKKGTQSAVAEETTTETAPPTLTEIYQNHDIGTLLNNLESFDLKKQSSKDDEYLQFANLLIQLSAIQKDWGAFSGAVEKKINAIKREIGRVNKKVYTDLNRQGVVTVEAPTSTGPKTPSYSAYYSRAFADLVREKKKGPFSIADILKAMKEQPKTGRPTNQKQAASQLKKLVKIGIVESVNDKFTAKEDSND